VSKNKPITESIPDSSQHK